MLSRKIIHQVTTIILILITLQLTYSDSPTTATAANQLQVPSTQYPTISSAIQAANDGDTINIAQGIYIENIHQDTNQTIAYKHNIKLLGQNQATTIINGTVALFGFQELTIKGLTITGSLTLGDPHSPPGAVVNSIITHNTIQSTTTIGGPNNKITNNIMHGLILRGGSSKMEWPTTNTLVENNLITGGIVVTSGSSANTFSSNIIAGASVGIAANQPSAMYYSTGGNIIYNNTITNNDIAVSLYSSVAENYPFHYSDTLMQNIIKDNNVGLEFYAPDTRKVPSLIYQNDFINNKAQVLTYDSITNIWNYENKGNFWSDYKGSDANNDGIGDTPYVIDKENQDQYPLIKPASEPTQNTTTPNLTSDKQASESKDEPTQNKAPQPQNEQSSTPPFASSNPTSGSFETPKLDGVPVTPELTPLAVTFGLILICLVLIVYRKRFKDPSYLAL